MFTRYLGSNAVDLPLIAPGTKKSAATGSVWQSGSAPTRPASTT